ncbi:MAG: Ig-like domain-containing protein, partial [Clostridia bacterium]|nr:Ig-like domain-containing protein [Clostridia bacterium]
MFEKNLTVGYLLDENGRKIAYCDDILPRSDPNFRIFHQMEAGERVFIRVSAFSNDTGLYRLVVALPQGVQSAPEGIELAVSRAEMDIGEHVDLQASVYPENGYHDLAYSTSDPLVARVSPEGVVTAVGAGDAKITVSGYGEVWSVCRIHV